ncbi:unnamed protein product [Callosobruchus maculatus]|uniref:peptidylprolyl isomerase n=1 Tax=Callosobruchus maculatus TaxID=64391 RepID=A0A653C364_CALMS|nr:unnamed protein product [Callosobruchus maculatus]
MLAVQHTNDAGIPDKMWQPPFVQFDTTMGEFIIELYWKHAPQTCRNFAELARRGYYNNTVFHRIIRDFMIQGGDPTGTGKGGLSIYGPTFKDEIHPELKHSGAGILSMANSGPDTNGSQFFITLAPTQWLDGKHAIFGRIHQGMNVIKRIGLVETDRNDRPMMTLKRNLPLVVILGSTGSGKTKLSLELAQRFDGEIIGADSMQIYKSLDISTAKATPEEQSVAPHHLIDILDPHETYTVTQYRNRALRVIQDVLDRNKLPIVVGGTNYYIEALLWKILVDNDEFVTTPGILPHNEHELPSEELHQKLKELDPKMANRLHPNNKRKILRALEIIYDKGKKVSDILAEQQSAQDASPSGGGLRFTNAIVLWLQCSQDILDDRLNKRVDSMVEQGLVNELLDFHHKYNLGSQPDYTKGIFQAIGFKEFHCYLMLSKEQQASDEGKEELAKAVEQLKLVTRRYAKKQKKWVTNRFLGRSDREVPPVYGLDTSDISKFEDNVTKIAEEIVTSYIEMKPCPHEPLPKISSRSIPNSLHETYTCSTCDRVFVGQLQWEAHLKSSRHRKRAAKKKSATPTS